MTSCIRKHFNLISYLPIDHTLERMHIALLFITEAMQAELKLHSKLSELYGVTLGRAGGFVRPSFVKIVIERYFTYIDGAFKDFEKKYKNANLPKDIIDDCKEKVKWIKNKQSHFNTIYIGGSTG